MFGYILADSVTTTKYMSTLIVSIAYVTLSIMCLVKFYCDITARSCLQLINTLIEFFLVNFVPF